MVTTYRILDANGQPIQLADLAEPQTSRVGQLHQEWQGHPARGLTPLRIGKYAPGASDKEKATLLRALTDSNTEDNDFSIPEPQAW